MTREEAARILDPETSRDELWKYEADTRIEACNEACRMGADALRAQQERENPKPVTNADRIRAMSDEELAVWLCDLFSVDTCYTHCPGYDFCNDAGGLSNGLKKWLQQPAEEDDDGKEESDSGGV